MPVAYTNMIQNTDIIKKIIEKYALTSEEVQKAIDDNILQKDIMNINLAPDYYGYRKQIKGGSAGNVIDPMVYYIMDGYNFYLLQFFLVIYKGNNRLGTSTFKDHIEYFKNPDSVYLIPLEKLKKFEITFGKYSEEVTSYLQKNNKDYFNSACIGNAIGGTVGALTMMRQKYDEPEYYNVSYNKKINTYNCTIVFEDGQIIFIENFWKYEGLDENGKKSKMLKVNEAFAKWISWNKNHPLLEDKQKEFLKSKISKKISLILGITFIIFIIILFFCIS